MGLIEKSNKIEYELEMMYNKIYELGLVKGYNRGYNNGIQDGMKIEKNKYKAAISDGLRHGSKKCAEVMGQW